MNLLQMNSLLNMNNSMNTMKTISSVDAKMQGQKGILETEIKHDKENGVDTAAKEQQLEGISDKHNSIQQTIMGIAEDINKESEKIIDTSEVETDENMSSAESENNNIAYSTENEEDFELELNGRKIDISKNNSENNQNKKLNVSV